MKILITGGYGYLGGRLSKYLVMKNHQVTITSRHYTQPPEWLPQVKVINTSEVEQVLEDVDCIIHLAGMNAQECTVNPLGALEVNGLFTGQLLQAAIKNKVKRFIYLSSAHVYSSPLEGEIKETIAVRNIHPYATSHKAGEDLVRYAHSKKEIEGIVIRLSNSFGSPTHVKSNCWMLLVNDICVQAIKNGKIVLNSSGEQKRDFITLADVERAINHLAELDKSLLDDGLFNVGGMWAPSIWEIAELVRLRCEDILGKKIILSKANGPSDPVPQELIFNISKLMNTGFKLESPINSEIDELIRFCVDHIKEIV
jgi:UDP-glucose 4-epimerase